MSLKAAVGKKILTDVVGACQSPVAQIQWKVLVVDAFATKILSSCCKMHEIVEQGVTVVEDVNKRRQPMPSLDAIYLLAPTQEAVDKIIADFHPKKRLYRNAYIFFMHECPEALFNKIKKSSTTTKCIKMLKEIDLAFRPIESQVFGLTDTKEIYDFYFETTKKGHVGKHFEEHIDSISDQIATLCSTLGEYPAVCYRPYPTEPCKHSEHGEDRNKKFALKLQEKLDMYTKENALMAEAAKSKSKSVLLILDRGFDLITPLLHELTFQAMIFDLLTLDGTVFEYEEAENEAKKRLDLSDQNENETWIALRHKHIAQVSQKVSKNLRNFLNEKVGVKATDCQNVKQLSLLIKKMPQYQKELSNFKAFFRLAEECMKTYNKGANQLCKMEQDLVMGVDGSGQPIEDPMKLMAPLLTDTNVTTDEKMRLLIMYILTQNGVTKENFDRLVHVSGVPEDRMHIFNGLTQLCANVVVEPNAKRHQWSFSRKNRVTEKTYQTSRWTPVLKDVLEELIDGDVDSSLIKFLKERPPAELRRGATSARFGKKDLPAWARTDTERSGSLSEPPEGPKMIVFVVGGVTYSEIRVAYEVTKAKGVKRKEKWQVFIGSDQILTPDSFMENLNHFDTHSK